MTEDDEMRIAAFAALDMLEEIKEALDTDDDEFLVDPDDLTFVIEQLQVALGE